MTSGNGCVLRSQGDRAAHLVSLFEGRRWSEIRALQVHLFVRRPRQLNVPIFAGGAAKW
jgi:hypothetical protein